MTVEVGRMQVTLRYFAGDPNWRIAEERLREVLQQEGDDAEISLVAVTSLEQAHELAFRGSPTILLDGVDPFPSEETGYGLTSRAYRTEAGTDGSPSVAQLTDAVRAARTSGR